MSSNELERELVVYAGLPAKRLPELRGMRMAQVLHETALAPANRKGFVREFLAPRLRLRARTVQRMTLEEISVLLDASHPTP